VRKQLFFWIFFAITALSMGADWYVHPDGSADPNGAMDHPFSTIRQALEAAQSGDRILLLPGVYSGAGNTTLNPEGKILTIQSLSPENPDMVASTILDPSGLGRGFVFLNNEGPQFVLQGLTIRNASCSQEDDPPHGAGIFCSGASPTIRLCIFENCNADGGWGGAFYGEFSNSVFDHCLFVGNKGRYGGAIAANLSSSISLLHCTIAGNTALFAGGGIVCDFESSVFLRNSILFFNTIEAPEEGMGVQIELRSSFLAASYSDIAAGTNDIRADEESFVTFGAGILHLDPLFAFYAPEAPLEELDFHLKSRFGRWDRQDRAWKQDGSTSPCIDAGDPNTPWSAEPWPNGKRVNLGFYGGTVQASLYGNPADFNTDGIADLFDLSEFLEVWLSNCTSDFHDLSRDGRVDFDDFELFSRHWLQKVKNSADFDLDGDVDGNDFALFSEKWLQEGDFPQDLNSDAAVDLNDLVLFVQEWLWKI